jgi:hypothetical protein
MWDVCCLVSVVWQPSCCCFKVTTALVINWLHGVEQNCKRLQFLGTARVLGEDINVALNLISNVFQEAIT